MLSWFREVDRVLRGDATRPESLAGGQIDVRGRRLLVANVLLGVVAGVCMGVFALFNREVPEYRQPLAAAIKVPALFYVTLAVTFPSLYVFNALVGSRLLAVTLARLMMAALGVTMAVLASFGPIVAFFSVTTPSYPFMLLLNVVVFALAGILGMSFLNRTTNRLMSLVMPEVTAAPPVEELSSGPQGLPLPPGLRSQPRDSNGQVRSVFAVWIIVFALVGAQMSWVLRPFLGHPDTPFAWFRPRSSNFFESVLNTLRALLGS
jgi:hypothetical protein